MRQQVESEAEGEKDVVRGKDPQCAPQIEAGERDLAALIQLREQEPRDEKAAQHEEDADAQTARDGQPGVVRDDQEDGDGPQAVQGRKMAATYERHYPSFSSATNAAMGRTAREGDEGRRHSADSAA